MSTGRRHFIGTLILTEDRTFNYRGYECAAWWQDVLVKAGRYDLVGHNTATQVYDARGAQQIEFDTIGAALPGKVTACDFGSRFGGVPIGPDTYSKTRIGAPAIYSLYWRGYTIGDLVAQHGLAFDMPNDPGVRIELDPALVAWAQLKFDHGPSLGVGVKIHNLLYPTPIV